MMNDHEVPQASDGNPDPLTALVQEYVEQKGVPGGVDAEAFARRHPELEARLLDVLHGLEMVERAAQAFEARHALEELDTLAVIGGARRRVGAWG